MISEKRKPASKSALKVSVSFLQRPSSLAKLSWQLRHAKMHQIVKLLQRRSHKTSNADSVYAHTRTENLQT
jgi:hypothetical protein